MAIKDWERRHNESWVERWLRLTGNAPRNPAVLKITKHVNCSALGWTPASTIHADARSLASQKFKKRRVYGLHNQGTWSDAEETSLPHAVP
jgi:hypothetical protein